MKQKSIPGADSAELSDDSGSANRGRGANGSRSDESLIKCILKGEIHLFEQLVEKYKRAVYYLVLSLMPAEQEDIEDIAQEVFLRAYASLDKFNFEYKFITWLLTITRNYTFDQIKKSRKHGAVLDDLKLDFDSSPAAANPARESLNIEKMQLISHLLGKLKDIDRTIVILRFYDEESYDDISRRLGIPASTIRSRFHRAIMKLQHDFRKMEA